MPEGETMFKFHGYSGDCPKPVALMNKTMKTEWQSVPKEPTEEMWSGLARAIMMGRDLECNKAHEMRKHLERGGNEIPAWLDKELDGEKHLAKGDMVVMIYKAMLATAPKPESLYTSTELKDTKSDVCIHPEQDALMNKAIDRMKSLVPDEISVIGVLVGLRDFVDRPDYCPKVMKEKLSECIDSLQKLYHEPAETVEGLAGALEYWDEQGSLARAGDREIIFKAARLWLRKQGE